MKRIVLLALALGMGLLLGGGIAYASIPASYGTINGCRKNTDGTLRVIDSTATCPNCWTALNWQQDSLAQLITISSGNIPLHFDAEGINGTAWSCPEGWPVAVSGGGHVGSTQNPPLVMTMSEPQQGQPFPRAWQVIWRNMGSVPLDDTDVVITLTCGRLVG